MDKDRSTTWACSGELPAQSGFSSIEPGIRELVQGFVNQGCPCPSKQSIDQRRRAYIQSAALAGKGPELHDVFEDVLDGLPIKVFKPASKDKLPITVYFHGGSFICGGFETHDQQLRSLAALSRTLVICVRYRLAPEHPYPAAHDDAFHAVRAIREHGKQYGGDPDNIVLAGDSAGGHLALVTSLRLKASGDWLPRKQVLIYPMLDAFGRSASYREYGIHYLVTGAMLLSGFDFYCSNSSCQRDHPEISPLYRDDFSGLPETYIVSAEFDPLRDECELLYKKLLASGVAAYCDRYLGTVHGFFQLSGVSQSAIRCVEQVARQIAVSV